MPQGPCRLGPMRSCIQPTTFRSKTMESSTVSIRNAKQKTAFSAISHQGSVPNIDRSSAARTLHWTSGQGERTHAAPHLRGLVVVGGRRVPRRSRYGPGRRAGPGIGEDAAARGVQRQPHHPVGHLGDPQRAAQRARRPGDGQLVAVPDPRLGGRRGGEPGRRPRAGCRPAPRRPPGAAPGRAAAGGPRAPPRPAAGWGTGARRTPGPVAARLHPSTGGRAGPARPARMRTSGSARCTSRASASMFSTRASVGTWRRVIWSGLSGGLEQPGPALPVEEGARLLHHGGDRQDHVGPVGDLAGPQLQADDEPAASRAPQRQRRIGQVLDARRPPTTSADSSPSAAASRICAGVAPAAGAAVRPRPRPGRPRRGPRGSVAGRPPGSSERSAPASMAPRSPARRGTHASVAPVAAAVRTAAVQRAGHGGEPLADDDDRALGRAAPRRPRSAAPPDRRRPRGRPATRSRCRARRTAACRPPSPGPGWRRGRARRCAARACGAPCAAAGRRRVPPPRPRSPASSTAGAASSAGR